jgi:phosphate transport system substrate-binding protein
MAGTVDPGPSSGTTPIPTVQRKSSRTPLYAAAAIVVIIVIVVAVGFSAGWFSPKKAATQSPPGVAACPTGTTLSGAGAAFINTIVSAWGPAYTTATGNQVSYNPAGSGTGVTDLTDSQVDFAASDGPLNATQTAAFPGQVLTLPVTAGALAIIYTLPGVTGAVQLSGSVLTGIFNGSITNWNATQISSINPTLKLPDSTIIPIVRSDGAGTTYVLTDFLSQESTSWASSVGKGLSVLFPKVTGEEAVKGNSLEISTVQKTSYAIGYTDLTDALGTTGLSFAKVQNPTGNYILPNLADTTSAIANKSKVTTFPSATASWGSVSMVNSAGPNDYPLATLAYFFVYQEGSHGYAPTSLAKDQVIQQWINWTISPTGGQALSNEYYYVTLPQALVTLDQAGLSTLTYNGAALPACG